MLALYRAGRQADALAAYQDARSALDELGLEPSGDLRSLEQRILRQDASLDAPVTRAAPPAGVPARTCLGPDRPGARARGRVGAPRPARHPPRHPHWAWWNGQDAPRAGAGTGARRRWTRRLRRSLVRERRGARAAHDRTRARRGRGARRGPRRDGAPPPSASRRPCSCWTTSSRSSTRQPDVGRLLDRVAASKALVTSRAPLRISAEREYRVPPLPVPELGARLAVRCRELGGSSALRRACPQEPPRLRRHGRERRRRGADLSGARRAAARPRAGRGPREVARSGRDRRATRRHARAPLTRGTRSSGAAALASRRDRLERAAARRAGSVGAGRAWRPSAAERPWTRSRRSWAPGSTFPPRSTTCWTRRSSRGRKAPAARRASRCSRRCASMRPSCSPRRAPSVRYVTAISTGSSTRSRATTCTGGARPTPRGSSGSPSTTTTAGPASRTHARSGTSAASSVSRTR